MTAVGVRETFEASPDHPWLAIGRGWTATQALNPGERIETTQGAPVTVVSVRATGRSVVTYNLTVADWHTYLVGDQGVVVHNGFCALAGRAVGNKTIWRSTAANLQEEMAMAAAKRGEGTKIMSNMTDSRYAGWDKFQIVSYSNDGWTATVHYMRDPATGAVADFKVFSKFHGPR